jgi:AcrR family transcriptional regulator
MKIMEDKVKIIKRKKGITTQNQILQTAAQLFACRGYDNVPVREIAKRVGVKESSIYNHFESKQHILYELFRDFAERAPLTRPSYEQLGEMIKIMSLKEILKNIMFSVGRNTDEILQYTAVIIQSEKFRNAWGAEAYYQSLVREPAEYYQNLVEMVMRETEIKNKKATEIMRYYCYMATSLSQEYFMAANGYGNVDEVVGRMLETIDFFCESIETGNDCI